MTLLSGVSLIRLFNFYLAAVFIIGVIVRIRQYRIVLGLIRAFGSRWPRLLALIKKHSTVLLSWRTMLPGVLTLTLMAVHTVASQFIWPSARLTLGQLALFWPGLMAVSLCGLAMTVLDVFLLSRSGEIDRQIMEKYFDQAEFWLKSWTAPVVRALSLGFIHPRRIVNTEVRNALAKGTGMLNTALWWVVLQTCLRNACGLALWLSYGMQQWLLPRTLA